MPCLPNNREEDAVPSELHRRTHQPIRCSRLILWISVVSWPTSVRSGSWGLAFCPSDAVGDSAGNQ